MAEQNAPKRNFLEYESYPDNFPVRRAEVEFITGLGIGAIKARVEDGSFPQPAIDGNRMTWRLGDVRRWVDELFAELAQ